MLCPLFSVVVVKWKGEVGSGFTVGPFHMNWLIDSECGGGYSLCLGSVTNDGQFTTIVGTGTFLPNEVVEFLHSEARSLVAAGRLIVCPASSVGCVQACVGWSDELLTNGFLSGAVSAVDSVHNDSQSRSRILDLASVSLPFVSGIALKDLATALDDLEDLLAPYRSLVFGKIRTGDLSNERWDSIRQFKEEALHAANRLDWEMKRRLSNSSASYLADKADVFVTDRLDSPQGTRASGFLQALVMEDRTLAPWVPYWRFRNVGGRLDWFSLRNKHLPEEDNTDKPDGCYWLMPPTVGVSIPVVAK